MCDCFKCVLVQVGQQFTQQNRKKSAMTVQFLLAVDFDIFVIKGILQSENIRVNVAV